MIRQSDLSGFAEGPNTRALAEDGEGGLHPPEVRA